MIENSEFKKIAAWLHTALIPFPGPRLELSPTDLGADSHSQSEGQERKIGPQDPGAKELTLYRTGGILTLEIAKDDRTYSHQHLEGPL